MLQHATLEVPKGDWDACIAFWGHLGFEPMQAPASLEGAGIEVTPGSNAWNADRVFVRDPVGHLIEIMSAPPVGPFTD